MPRFPVSVVQSRVTTPNYYLFRDFCRALEKSPLFDLQTSGLLQDIEVKKRENLFVFGGEDLLNWKLMKLIRLSDNNFAWFTEDPYETERNVKSSRLFTKIFTTDEFSVKSYGHNAAFIPLGTIQSSKSGGPVGIFQYDLVLFGSIWPNRIDLLEKLAKNESTTKLRILLLTSQMSASWVDQVRLRQVKNWIIGNGGEILEITRPLDLVALGKLLEKARVCLNWPRSFGDKGWSVPGPRVIEVAMAGKVQLLNSEMQPGLNAILSSKMYLDYKDSNLCDQVVAALTLSDEHLLNIADLAREHVNKHFTWDRIIEILHQELISK
jgi:hypothetical protein